MLISSTLFFGTENSVYSSLFSFTNLEALGMLRKSVVELCMGMCEKPQEKSLMNVTDTTETLRFRLNFLGIVPVRTMILWAHYWITLMTRYPLVFAPLAYILINFNSHSAHTLPIIIVFTLIFHDDFQTWR